jgi:hypothetical protein
MKRLSVLLLSAAVLLSACSWLPSRQRDEQARAEAALAAARKPAPRTVAADGTPIVTSDGVEIEKVEFRAGVSSATVENLAKQAGCHGGLGAGLLSSAGPVEIYRMTCEDGKVFIAKCELRQCRAM